MKKTLTLLLLATVVSTPVLAQSSGQVSRIVAPVAAESTPAAGSDEILLDAETLAASMVSAAREVAFKRVLAPPAPQGEGGKLGSGSRTIIGIAMLVGGAAIIYKGVDIYQDEPDRFGRTKNADSYLAYGVGGTIMFFGALVLRGGLQGQGFQ